MREFLHKYWTVLLFFTIIHLLYKVPAPVAEATMEPQFPYTEYQIITWALKYQEGFRDTWYSDGKFKAIGYGYNHLGDKERILRVKRYMKGGKLDKAGATKLLTETWSKIKVPANLCPTQRIAWILHCYNKGSVAKVVWRCCGKSWGIGCGNKNKEVRSSHTSRREFEYALWHNDLEFVKQYIEKARKSV